MRKQMLHDCVYKAGGDPALLNLVEPVWTGTIAYRGLIPVERLKTPSEEHRTIKSPMMVCRQFFSATRGHVDL